MQSKISSSIDDLSVAMRDSRASRREREQAEIESLGTPIARFQWDENTTEVFWPSKDGYISMEDYGKGPVYRTLRRYPSSLLTVLGTLPR